MDILEVKYPRLKSEVHPLIRKRWSPLSFSNKTISDEIMAELFEAASWAPSAYNEQPWEYVYAHRSTKGFEKLWECLKEGNQPWTRSAAVIFVAVKKNIFSKNGTTNEWASHDVGMANAQLLLQAVSRNIYGHLMAGFDSNKLKQTLNLSDDQEPVCMGALGYLGNAENLSGTYKERELRPRIRKPVTEFIHKLDK